MKPCPFFGCRDITEGEDSSGEVYYVQCAKCKANIYLPWHPNIDEVKKDVHWLWNQGASTRFLKARQTGATLITVTQKKLKSAMNGDTQTNYRPSNSSNGWTIQPFSLSSKYFTQ